MKRQILRLILRNDILKGKIVSPGCQRRLSTEVPEVAVKSSKENEEVEKVYKNIMKKVPQPVLVATTAEYDILKHRWYKRGMTCTSFTNVSYQPAIVSICINNPSQMHNLLLRTQHFALHVLAKDQMKYGISFSKHGDDDVCQFADIPHEQGDEGVPLISGCLAVMQCKAHSVHTVGDHHVWYGNVTDASITTDASKADPLLYFVRSFRSVGDEIFLQAFEDASLPFEDWTHEAHLRMAWNYITEFGKDGATPYIREGIQKFNEQNKDKVKFGYHETITRFYTSVVAEAVNRNVQATSFEDFLNRNSYLLDRGMIAKFYSKNKLYSEIARKEFVAPDLQPLPC